MKYLQLIIRSASQHLRNRAATRAYCDQKSAPKGVVSEEGIKLFFKNADTNNDGFITSKELTEMMKRFDPKMTEDRVEAFIKRADLSHDSLLDYEEFKSILQSYIAQPQKPKDEQK